MVTARLPSCRRVASDAFSRRWRLYPGRTRVLASAHHRKRCAFWPADGLREQVSGAGCLELVTATAAGTPLVLLHHTWRRKQKSPPGSGALPGGSQSSEGRPSSKIETASRTTGSRWVRRFSYRRPDVNPSTSEALTRLPARPTTCTSRPARKWARMASLRPSAATKHCQSNAPPFASCDTR